MLAGDVGADAGQEPGGARAVGGAFTVEVRHEHEPVGARRRRQRQLVEPARFDAQEAGDGVGDLGGVERADERQEPAGGVGEAGDGAARIGRGDVDDAEGGAARAEAEGHVAGGEGQAERRRHVVAGARRDHHGPSPRSLPRPGGIGGSEHRRQHRFPVQRVVDQGEEVGSISPLRRRPPTGAGRIAPIGGEASRESVGEPVVRQQHPTEPPEDLGLGALSHRSFVMVKLATGTCPHASAHASAPNSTTRAAASSDDSVSFQSLAGRSTSPVASRATSPCCWPPTAIAAGRWSPKTPASPAAASNAAHQSAGCCSLRGGVVGGCGARPEPTRLAGVEVAHLHLAGRRRRVDAGDERHPRYRAPRRCSMASWSTRLAPWERSPFASASKVSNAVRSASRSA